MKHRIAVLVAALGIAFASPAGLLAPSGALAHSCKRGKHAVINGAHKCLARGQFCARGADAQYHRYGFHCHKRDARGNYHLT
jgi:hypothetical protein